MRINDLQFVLFLVFGFSMLGASLLALWQICNETPRKEYPNEKFIIKFSR